MAISEAISLVPPDPETPSTSHAHSDQGFLPSSPNPALAPSGVDHAVLDEKLDLKEEGEDDGEPDEVQKLDSIEKVEEDEAGELQKVDLKAEDEAGELQKVDLKAEDGAGELQKVEFYEGVEVPLNPTSVPSPALSDLVDWIRTLDPAVLNRIRNRDPAFLQEIQQFDPTVEIRNLAPAFPSEFSESVDVPQNPPSVPSPEPSVVEILDWIRTLGPAVLDEIQQFDPAFLDEDRSFDPSIVDGIRKLSLKEKEEKEEEEKERETEKEKENEKERENESSSSSSSGSGGGNENGGEVEKKVVEESSRRNQYPLRPEAGDCSYYPKTGNCKFGWNCTLNHPRRRKNKQVSKDKAKQREELEKKQDQTESKYYISPGRRIAAPSVAPALELNFSDLPIRLIDLKVSKDKAKQREELEEKQDQTESKYYISPGRRIGVPSVAPALELNFSDLPIRPVSKDKAKQREELEKRQDLTESKVSKDKAKQREELEEKQDQSESKVSKDKAKQREELEKKQEQTESKYYISPGRRIGVPSVAPALELNFPDLPIRLVSKAKAKQREKLEEKQFQTESKVSKDEAKQREGLEDLEEKQDQTESKYYISPGRRIGVPSVAPALKLNFSDSPIRPVSKDKAKQREELEEKQEQTESKVSKVKAKQREELEEKQDQTERKVSKDKAKQREELEELEEKQEQTESKVSKDKAKQREELEELKEKQDQTESKYYISPGRRIGVPSVAAALEFNFLGLPIRPGEKDCSYYMQTASCKYETNCKFNHPDPTAAGESRPQSAYGNGRAASLQGLPNSQGINSEATEWNGYQAPAHLPHRSMPAPPPSVHRSMPAPAPPPYVMNNSVTETNYCGQYAQQTQAEEFPERPGQPVCFYFTQTGDCVNKSNCQYHHPKNQTAATPSCAPSDRGLPLRPGQNICTEYSRFGVCSSGPTCIFDHPSLSDSFL
ncbi:DNA ligase 1 isoform X2 [Pyrus x bretschneideri]|uniref:DNA ligase 1 isoform X2 n=1 Tax=Pyrus x bretschneideri TaxID=225117 RepID=UPI00202E4527|nr:DNA ligase 1 isoform X2 [Pyrus x bretschneideri]